MWTQADFAAHAIVSRETLAGFSLWNDNLIKWNKRINLVASNSVDEFWHRHAYDSWQLTQYLPDGWSILVDLGSGGGFPGLAMGLYAKASVGAQDDGEGATTKQVYLVESIKKKASFLKTVARELSLPVQVYNQRIEDLPPLGADVLTARAFAPLPRLFDYAERHLSEGAVLILPKGEGVDKEIETAYAHWKFKVERFKSETSDTATILRVSELSRLRQEPS